MSKEALFERGLKLAKLFCAKNGLTLPEIRRVGYDDWRFDSTCAYYRPSYIAICVEKCASFGRAGRAWSWPGYVVDRTPYGVIQHELGHHVDWTFSKSKGAYFGDYSEELRAKAGEPALTGYCPNTAEWFAEIFRLFVTNSDLLRGVRPKAFAEISKKLNPAVTTPWRDVLEDAPARTIISAEKKLRS